MQGAPPLAPPSTAVRQSPPGQGDSVHHQGDSLRHDPPRAWSSLGYFRNRNRISLHRAVSRRRRQPTPRPPRRSNSWRRKNKAKWHRCKGSSRACLVLEHTRLSAPDHLPATKLPCLQQAIPPPLQPMAPPAASCLERPREPLSSKFARHGDSAQQHLHRSDGQAMAQRRLRAMSLSSPKGGHRGSRRCRGLEANDSASR